MLVQENGARAPSDMDASLVSGRSNASRNSVARLGGSLVHSSSTTGVRHFFAPLPLFYSETLPNLFFYLAEGGHLTHLKNTPICQNKILHFFSFLKDFFL